jgi:hypothetical protein
MFEIAETISSIYEKTGNDVAPPLCSSSTTMITLPTFKFYANQICFKRVALLFVEQLLAHVRAV